MAKTAEAMAALRANDRVLAGAGLAALVGATLAGCATTATRAPVEDRAVERPAAAAPAAAPATGSYTVRRNDTLYSIAWRHDLDYKALAAANGIEAPYTIHPGRRLRLPAGDAAAVQPPAPAVRKPAPATAVPKARPRQQREQAAPPPPRPAVPRTTDEQPRPRPTTVAPAAPKPPVPAPSKRVAPKPEAPPPAKVPSLAKPLPAKPGPSSPAAVAGWQRPVAAKPVRAFGGASKGLDYALSPATRVRAAAPGVVVYAGPGLGGFRHLVIVKASERYLVAYGINVQPRLQEGETVAAGATVAEIGSGGAAGKFHFEIRDRGKPVDPRPLVGGA